MTESKRLAYELRKSHFRLGHDISDPKTTYKMSYPSFSQDSHSSVNKTISGPELRRAHFVLGTDQNNSFSSYKNDFQEKRCENVALDKSIMKDLRTNHYELGYAPKNEETFKSIYAKNYQNFDQEKVKEQFIEYRKMREKHNDSAFFKVNKTYDIDRNDYYYTKNKGETKAKDFSKSFIENPRYFHRKYKK